MSLAATVRGAAEQLRTARRPVGEAGAADASFVDAADFVTGTLADVTERLRRVNDVIARLEATTLNCRLGRL
ncbi:MAG TPA: hypothetical protein VEA69_16195 [Tepidisphaeraceae bacterium]|nr:hypothetical protein [Tepidisphaeraceae bacterium]